MIEECFLKIELSFIFVACADVFCCSLTGSSSCRTVDTDYHEPMQPMAASVGTVSRIRWAACGHRAQSATVRK